MAGYIPTIGIECHVQFKTRTKIFAAVSNDARGAAPNSLVSPVCFGLPGVLPVLNAAVIELAIRAGHALNAKINQVSVFDRKHYFYPDLPKGYQISQFHEPIVGKGFVEVPTKDGYQKVGITRAHLEEDAGKLTHVDGTDYSLVDLNRAGTPLLEIVSEPDMHSAEVARNFAQELYNLMTYADVTDGDLYHGNMRFDVNISLAKPGSKTLGIRAEIKNLNSFKAVQRVVEFEIQRQTELLEKGQPVPQETRGWDEAKQKTIAQRTKEDAHDYRYFPDPDIPPLELSIQEIEAQAAKLPELPKQRRDKFVALDLSVAQAETLVNNKHLGDILAEVVETSREHGKKIGNLLTDAIAAELAERPEQSVAKLDAARLIKLAELSQAGKLNSNAVDKVAKLMLEDTEGPLAIAEKNNLIQLSDESQLVVIIKTVVREHSQAVSDLKAGEAKAKGFLVGQVMQKTGGNANPQMVNELLDKEIAKI